MNENENTRDRRLSGLPDMPASAPSRRRGRPPKNQVITISTLAPSQESATLHSQDVPSVTPGPSTQPPTVPSPLQPLEPVLADDVDLRETPAMAAKHSMDAEQLSGSDSKVRGASDGYLPVEAGPVLHPNPALPETFNVPTTSNVEPAPSRAVGTPSSNWTPVQVGDVVQVNSHKNKLMGTLFIVGDIKHHKVHGYQIRDGGKLEYFTVNEDECILVGSMSRGQIRSRSGCSAKWKAEQR